MLILGKTNEQSKLNSHENTNGILQKTENVPQFHMKTLITLEDNQNNLTRRSNVNTS